MINFTLKQRALGAALLFLMAFYIFYIRPMDMETFWQGEQPTSIAVAYEEWGTGKSEAGTTSRREEILTEDPDEIQRFCAVLNARKLRREIPWAALTGGESFSYEETGLVRIWLSVNYAKRDGGAENGFYCPDASGTYLCFSAAAGERCAPDFWEARKQGRICKPSRSFIPRRKTAQNGSMKSYDIYNKSYFRKLHGRYCIL